MLDHYSFALGLSCGLMLGVASTLSALILELRKGR
jgi:hypothetical protein